MDLLRVEVEPLPDGFGQGAYLRAQVNGRDLLDPRDEFAPDEAQGVANHAIVPLRAQVFPRGLFYGHVGYSNSPFDDRVALLCGYYCPACCDLLTRITVHEERVDWTNFGTPDLGTRGWKPSALGDFIGAFVFRRSDYDAAVEDAAREFERLFPATPPDGGELTSRVDRAEALLGSLPEFLSVTPADHATLPRLDRGDAEAVATMVVPRLRAIITATTALMLSGHLTVGRQARERLQIWRWNLAQATARLEEALASFE